MKISKMVVAAMCIAMLNAPAFATSYYMSGGGNDANSGLIGTAAFKSVSKMNAQAFVCGDRIYVDGSSAPTADATLHISGPNSASGLFPQNLSTSTCASSPIIIDTYNATCTFSSADPPVPSGCGTLTPPSGKHGIFIDNASGVTVQNIAVVGSGADTATTYGIMFTNSDWYGQTSPPSGITYDHLTADHNYVTGFDTLIRVQEIVGADKLDTVTISNNALVGTTGLETEGIRVQGQMGAACCYSPNGPQGQLTNTNFDIHGNYVTNVQGQTGGPGGANGNGIIVGEVNGGKMYWNHVKAVGQNSKSCGGPAGLWQWDSNNVHTYQNEVEGVGPSGGTWPGSGCDWNGFGFDLFNTSSTIEQNYSHDNFGSCFYAYISGTPSSTGVPSWQNNVFSDNVGVNCAKDGHAGGEACIGVSIRNYVADVNTAANLSILRNTCFHTAAASGTVNGYNGCALNLGNDLGSGSVIEDNILYGLYGSCSMKAAAGWTGTLNNNDHFRNDESTSYLIWYNGTANSAAGGGGFSSFATYKTAHESNAKNADPIFNIPSGVSCTTPTTFITAWPPCPSLNYQLKNNTSPMIGAGEHHGADRQPLVPGDRNHGVSGPMAARWSTPSQWR